MFSGSVTVAREEISASRWEYSGDWDRVKGMEVEEVDKVAGMDVGVDVEGDVGVDMVVRTWIGSVGSLAIDRAWLLTGDTARVVVFVSVSVSVAGAVPVSGLVAVPVAVPVSVRVSVSEPVSIPIDASSIIFQSQSDSNLIFRSP
jgi:hypothetical protein